MLESYFDLLCISLSLVQPPGKIPLFVSCTLLFTGITTLTNTKY